MIRVLLMACCALTPLRLENISPELSGVGLALFLVIATLAVAWNRVRQGYAILPFELFRIPVIFSIAVYFLAGVISGVAGGDRYFYEVATQFLWMVLPLYIFSVGATGPDDLKYALLAYLPPAVVIACLAIIRVVAGQKYWQFMGTYNHVTLGDICAALLVIAVAMGLSGIGGRQRNLIIFPAAAIGLTGLVLSGSRAPLFAAMLAIVAMGLMRGVKPLKVAMLATLAALSAGVLFAFLPTEMQERLSSFGAGSSFNLRLIVWEQSAQYLIANPLGLMGWGESPEMLTPINILVKHTPCNAVLEAWMQTGPLGALGMLAMIITAFFLPVQNSRRLSSENGLFFVNLAALGIIMIFLISSLQDAFIGKHSDSAILYEVIGMTVYLKFWLDQRNAQRKPEPLPESAQAQAL